MTGPEHYKSAEDLMRDAETAIELDVSHYLLAAHVHATLAQVALDAEVALNSATVQPDWAEVIV